MRRVTRSVSAAIAGTYTGYTGWKKFRNGWFQGRVGNRSNTSNGQLVYRIVYADGDREDMSIPELHDFLATTPENDGLPQRAAPPPLVLDAEAGAGQAAGAGWGRGRPHA